MSSDARHDEPAPPNAESAGADIASSPQLSEELEAKAGADESALAEAISEHSGDADATRDKAPRESRFAPWLALVAYTAIVLVAIWPMLGTYVWTGHDMFFSATRTKAMAEVWASGGPWQAPWMADVAYGYGMPFFAFYPPLAYYVGSAGRFAFGLGWGDSAKFSFLLAFWLSGLFMGGFAWSLAKREGSVRPAGWALAAATAYAFAPYHLAGMFTRAALAECWAWPAAAALFWAAEAGRGRPARCVALVAVSYAALALSHNVMAVYGPIFLGLLVAATALDRRDGRFSYDWRWVGFVALGGALGAGLAAFFWLPAMKLLPLVRASDPSVMWATPEIVGAKAIHWRQLLVESLGRDNGPDVYNVHIEYALNLGRTLLGAIIVAIAALGAPKQPLERRWRLFATLGVLALALFMTTSWMRWGWTPKLLWFVQFPWRLLLFGTLLACAAMARASVAAERWIHPLVATVAAALIIPAIQPMMLMTHYPPMSDEQLDQWAKEREFDIRYFAGCAAQEYVPLAADPKHFDPEWIKANPPPSDRLEPVDETASFAVEDFERRGARYEWEYRAGAEATVRARLYDFPGWLLSIDGKPANERLEKDEEGLLRLKLPAGAHVARLEQGLSGAHWMGWAASAVSLVALLGVLWWLRPRRAEEREAA